MDKSTYGAKVDKVTYEEEQLVTYEQGWMKLPMSKSG